MDLLSQKKLPEIAKWYDGVYQKQGRNPNREHIFMDAYMQAIDEVQGILNSEQAPKAIVRKFQSLVMVRNNENQIWRQAHED